MTQSSLPSERSWQLRIIKGIPNPIAMSYNRKFLDPSRHLESKHIYPIEAYGLPDAEIISNDRLEHALSHRLRHL